MRRLQVLHSNQSGATLIETVVALAIVTVLVALGVAVAANTVTRSGETKNAIIANNAAAVGIETARYLRDIGQVLPTSDDECLYLVGVNETGEPYFSYFTGTNTCSLSIYDFDDARLYTGPRGQWSAGYYGHSTDFGATEATQFYRRLRIYRREAESAGAGCGASPLDLCDPSHYHIVSEVAWRSFGRDHQVVQEADLYDWQEAAIDEDGDGYGSWQDAGPDCNDVPGSGELINPGQPEIGADLIDNDCDGEIDEV